MKTTIEIDQEKLERVMKLAGLKTRKETIDFALTQAERWAKIHRLFSEPFFEDDNDVIDPAYDLLRLRELERPETK